MKTLWYLVAMVSAGVHILLNSVIVYKFWGWFIVPPFYLDPLSFRHAVGLVAAYMLWKARDAVDADAEKGPISELIMGAIKSAITVGLILGIGYFVQWVLGR